MKKNRIVFFMIFLAFITAPSFGQSLQMKLGDYSVVVNTAPKKGEGTSLAFLQAVPTKTVNGQKQFGFWFGNGENKVVEITDAASKEILLNLTGADLMAKPKTETLNNGSRMISTYQLNKASAISELQFEAAVATDQGMPMGKKMTVTVKARLSKAETINAFLNLKTDGKPEQLGAAGLVTIQMDNDSATYPGVVIAVSPNSAKFSVDGQNVVLEADNISGERGSWTTLFSFDVAGTTVKDGGKSLQQANRIVNHVAMKEEVPELAIFNSANKISTLPGDTVTYTISYENIGSGLAQDAEISNPVPDGVALIESSVNNKGADVTIERKPAVAPEVGEPMLVKWKIKGKIMPGEGGRVTMKVIVK